MESEEMFKDWLFRYRYMFPKRLTKKNKNKFMRALITDISQIRKDITIIEYDKSKKESSCNLYIGDIEKADKIICTYYDTPPNHMGDYLFFNTDEQKKLTTKYIIISSLIFILIGICGSIVIFNQVDIFNNYFSVETLLIIIMYMLYFYFLGRVTKGDFFKKTLVRNTSSVITLLELLKENKNNKNIAFAFLDDGCYGERGLEVMDQVTKKDAIVYYLDSIGSRESLIVLGNHFNKNIIKENGVRQYKSHNSINYIISAEVSSENNSMKYFLNKHALKQKELNLYNINLVLKLFK